MDPSPAIAAPIGTLLGCLLGVPLAGLRRGQLSLGELEVLRRVADTYQNHPAAIDEFIWSSVLPWAKRSYAVVGMAGALTGGLVGWGTTRSDDQDVAIHWPFTAAFAGGLYAELAHWTGATAAAFSTLHPRLRRAGFTPLYIGGVLFVALASWASPFPFLVHRD